ncbi:MAG: flagellar basal body P-ring formation protein FlgA [Synergistaceae bacterium]|nr:flagellar basal body P-ring formation protein FlgA [Synergistaceae bacterium]
MKSNIFRQGLIWLLLFAVSAQAFAAQSLILEIPSVVYANKGTVRLGEIARIKGGNKRTREMLADVQLWNDGREISRKDVMRAIDESDLSDIRLEIRMPLISKVEPPDYEGNFTETGGSSYAQRSVNDLVPLLKELSGWNGGLEISANNPVPDGTLIDPASLVPGTSGATLRFRDDSGRVKPLNVRLTWLQNTVIASRNIKRGDKISRSDVFTRPMKINRVGVYPSDVSEVLGFTSNKNFRQGEPIELSALTSSQTLKRGRQVKIVASYGGATASADGVLLEDGKPGEWVRVRRADDRKITLRARIIDENTVAVSTD